MNDELKKLLTSIGALSELLGIMRDELIKSGFTRSEAVYLTGVVIQSAIQSQYQCDDEGGDSDKDYSGDETDENDEYNE